MDIFSSALGETLTPMNIVIVIVSALILGLATSLVYIFTHKDSAWQRSFVLTMIMLPATLAIVIMLCENNIARAFSLGGAISIIRFRSAPGDAKDISYIFVVLAIGLCCGTGYIAYGVIFVLIIALVMFLLDAIHYGETNTTDVSLHITIPESLSFENAFDDILKKYSKTYKLHKVKTADFGSLFELSYDIQLLDGCDRKKLMDEIRVRNGNLPISVTFTAKQNDIVQQM